MKRYLTFKGIFFILIWWSLLLFPWKILQTIIILFALESIMSLLYTIFFLSNQEDNTLKYYLIFITFSQLILSLILLIFPEIVHIILSIAVLLLAIILGIIGYNILSIAKIRAATWLPHSLTLQSLWFLMILCAIFIGINSFTMVLTLIALFGLVIIGLGIGYIIQALKREKPIIINPESDDEEY